MQRGDGQRARLHPQTLGAVLLVVALTAVFSWVAFTVNDHNERRLLRLKVAETGALLQTALPTVSAPLASAVEIAQDGNGGAAGFTKFMAGYVGGTLPFAYASLWAHTTATRPVATLGTSVMARQAPASIRSLIARAAAHPGLSIEGFLAGSPRVIGYAYASPHAASGPIVYAESPLPAKPRIPPTRGTPFSDLRFALYLGRRATPAMLLETNTGDLGSRTATTVVPFGDQALTVVATSNGPLAGGLSSSLWWIFATAGAILALGAGAVTERLIRRRLAAESLAGNVQRLLSRQQAISSTLQDAMIPRAPADRTHLEIASRYLPGADGLELGGDWFDVIALDGDRTFISIGDVCGRGVSAGTVMASLRSAVAAFVSEGHGPAEVLGRLGRMLGAERGERFATLGCLVLDSAAGTVDASSAGHLPPLLIKDGGAEFLGVPVGPPIGAIARPITYRQQRFSVSPGATLVLYTDGLVERRGEDIDTGLDRLRRVAAATVDSGATRTVEQALEHITRELRVDTRNDDTAVLAIRLLPRQASAAR